MENKKIPQGMIPTYEEIMEQVQEVIPFKDLPTGGVFAVLSYRYTKITFYSEVKQVFYEV